MYEIRMNNGSYFWTPGQPTWLLTEQPERMVQLGTAANVGASMDGTMGLRRNARKQLGNGQIQMTFLNPDHVSSIVNLGD